MFFGMTFWGLVWFIIKLIVAVAVGLFIIKLLFAFGVAGLMVWAEKKKK